MSLSANVQTGLDNFIFNLDLDTQRRVENINKVKNYVPDMNLPSPDFSESSSSNTSFNFNLTEPTVLNGKDIYESMFSNDPLEQTLAFNAVSKKQSKDPQVYLNLGMDLYIPYEKTRKYLDKEYGYDPLRGNQEDFYYRNVYLPEKDGFFNTVNQLFIQNPLNVLTRTGISAVSSLLTGTITVAEMLNPFNWNSNFWTSVADNSLVKGIEDVERNMKDSDLLVRYRSLDYDKMGFFAKMGEANFWSEDFADGAGFLLSAFVPAMGFSKLGKLGAIGKLGRASKFMGAPILENSTSMLGKGTRAALRGITGSDNFAEMLGYGYNVVNESAMEAVETYKSSMENLKSLRDAGDPLYANKSNEELNKIAGKNAAFTFKGNLAALSLSNGVQNRIFNKINGRIVDANISKYITFGEEKIIRKPFSKWDFTSIDNPKLYRSVKALGSLAAEGVWEENAQLAISRMAEGRYTKRSSDKTTPDEEVKIDRSGNVISTFLGQGIQQTLDAFYGDDIDASTSIGLGGLIGILGSVGGSVISKEISSQNNEINKIIENLNSAYSEFFNFKKAVTIDANGEVTINNDLLNLKLDVIENYKKQFSQPGGFDIKNKEDFIHFIGALHRAGIEEDFLNKLKDKNILNLKELSDNDVAEIRTLAEEFSKIFKDSFEFTLPNFSNKTKSSFKNYDEYKGLLDGLRYSLYNLRAKKYIFRDAIDKVDSSLFRINSEPVLNKASELLYFKQNLEEHIQQLEDVINNVEGDEQTASLEVDKDALALYKAKLQETEDELKSEIDNAKADPNEAYIPLFRKDKNGNDTSEVLVYIKQKHSNISGDELIKVVQSGYLKSDYEYHLTNSEIQEQLFQSDKGLDYFKELAQREIEEYAAKVQEIQKQEEEKKKNDSANTQQQNPPTGTSSKYADEFKAKLKQTLLANLTKINDPDVTEDLINDAETDEDFDKLVKIAQDNNLVANDLTFVDDVLTEEEYDNLITAIFETDTNSVSTIVDKITTISQLPSALTEYSNFIKKEIDQHNTRNGTSVIFNQEHATFRVLSYYLSLPKIDVTTPLTDDVFDTLISNNTKLEQEFEDDFLTDLLFLNKTALLLNDATTTIDKLESSQSILSKEEDWSQSLNDSRIALLSQVALKIQELKSKEPGKDDGKPTADDIIKEHEENRTKNFVNDETGKEGYITKTADADGKFKAVVNINSETSVTEMFDSLQAAIEFIDNVYDEYYNNLINNNVITKEQAIASLEAHNRQDGDVYKKLTAKEPEKTLEEQFLSQVVSTKLDAEKQQKTEESELSDDLSEEETSDDKDADSRIKASGNKARGNYIDIVVDTLRANGNVTIVTELPNDHTKANLAKAGVALRKTVLNRRFSETNRPSNFSVKIYNIDNLKELVSPEDEKEFFSNNFNTTPEKARSDDRTTKIYNIGVLTDSAGKIIYFDIDGSVTTAEKGGKPVFLNIKFKEYSTSKDLSYRAGDDSETTGSNLYKFVINYLKKLKGVTTSKSLFENSSNNYKDVNAKIKNGEPVLFSVDLITNGEMLRKMENFKTVNELIAADRNNDVSVKIERLEEGERTENKLPLSKAQPIITFNGKEFRGAFLQFKNLKEIDPTGTGRGSIPFNTGLLETFVNEGLDEKSPEYQLISTLINNYLFTIVDHNGKKTVISNKLITRQAKLDKPENLTKAEINKATLNDLLESRVAPKPNIAEQTLFSIVGTSAVENNEIVTGVNKRLVISYDVLNTARLFKAEKELKENIDPDFEKQLVNKIAKLKEEKEKELKKLAITRDKELEEAEKQSDAVLLNSKGEPIYKTTVRQNAIKTANDSYEFGVKRVNDKYNPQITELEKELDEFIRNDIYNLKKISLETQRDEELETVKKSKNVSDFISKYKLSGYGDVTDPDFKDQIKKLASEKIYKIYAEKLAELEKSKESKDKETKLPRLSIQSINTIGHSFNPAEINEKRYDVTGRNGIVKTVLFKTRTINSKQLYFAARELADQETNKYKKNNIEKIFTVSNKTLDLDLTYGTFLDYALRLTTIDFNNPNDFENFRKEFRGTGINARPEYSNFINKYLESLKELKLTKEQEEIIVTNIERFAFNMVRKTINYYSDLGYDLYSMNSSDNKGGKKLLYNTELYVNGEADIIAIPKVGRKDLLPRILDLKTSYSGLINGDIKPNEKIQTSIYAYSLAESSNNAIPNATKIGIIRVLYDINIIPLDGNIKLLTDSEINKNVDAVTRFYEGDPENFSILKKSAEDFKNQILEKTKEYEELKNPTIVNPAPASSVSGKSETPTTSITRNRNKNPDEKEPLYQVIRSSERLATSEEINEQIQFIRERFGDSIEVNRLQNVFNSAAGAEFVRTGVNFAINIFERTNYGSGYHEAFHAFSQLYLTREEKEKLYNSIKKLNISWVDRQGNNIDSKTASFFDVEEFLAEQFKNYAIASKENTKFKFNDNMEMPKETKGIFAKLLDLIKSIYQWFKGTNETNTLKAVSKLFSELNNNTFNKNNYSPLNVMFDKLNQGFKYYTGENENVQQELPVNIFERFRDYLDTKILFDISYRGILSSNLLTYDENNPVSLPNLMKRYLKELIPQEGETFISENEVIHVRNILNIKSNNDIANSRVVDSFIELYITESKISILKNNYYSREDRRAIKEAQLEKLNSDIDETSETKEQKHNRSGNETNITDVATASSLDFFASIPMFTGAIYTNPLVDKVVESKSYKDIEDAIKQILFNNNPETAYLKLGNYGAYQLMEPKTVINKLHDIIGSTTSFWDDKPNSFKSKLKKLETIKGFPEAMIIYYFLDKNINHIDGKVETFKSLLNTVDAAKLNIEKDDIAAQVLFPVVMKTNNQGKTEYDLDKSYERVQNYINFYTNIGRIFSHASVSYFKIAVQKTLDGNDRVTFFENLTDTQVRTIDYMTSGSFNVNNDIREYVDLYDDLYARLKNNASLIGEDGKLKTRLEAKDILNFFRTSKNLNGQLVLKSSTQFYLDYRTLNNIQINDVTKAKVFLSKILNITDFNYFQTTNVADEALLINSAQKILKELKDQSNSLNNKLLIKVFERNRDVLNRFLELYEAGQTDVYKNIPELDKLFSTFFMTNPLSTLEAATELVAGSRESSRMISTYINLSKLIQKYNPKFSSSATIVGPKDNPQTENKNHVRSVQMVVAELINNELVNEEDGFVSLSKFQEFEELEFMNPLRNPYIWQAVPYLQKMFVFDKANKTLKRVHKEGNVSLPLYNIQISKFSQYDSAEQLGINKKAKTDTTMAKDLDNETKTKLGYELHKYFNGKISIRPEASNSEFILGVISTENNTVQNGTMFQAPITFSYQSYFSLDELSFLNNKELSERILKSKFSKETVINQAKEIFKFELYKYYQANKYDGNNTNNRKGFDENVLGIFTDPLSKNLKDVILAKHINKSIIANSKAETFEEFFSELLKNKDFQEVFNTQFPLIYVQLELQELDTLKKTFSSTESTPTDSFNKVITDEELEEFIVSSLMHDYSESSLFFGNYTDYKDPLKRRKMHVNTGYAVLSGDVFIHGLYDWLDKLRSITSIVNDGEKTLNSRKISYLVANDPIAKSNEVTTLPKEFAEVLKKIVKSELSKSELDKDKYRQTILDYVKDPENTFFRNAILSQQLGNPKYDSLKEGELDDELSIQIFKDIWLNLWGYFNMELANGSTPFQNLDSYRHMALYTNVWTKSKELQYQIECAMNILRKDPSLKRNKDVQAFIKQHFDSFNNQKNAYTGHSLSYSNGERNAETVHNSTFVKTSFQPSTLQQFLPGGAFDQFIDQYDFLYKSALTFITYPTSSKGFIPETVDDIADIEMKNKASLDNKIREGASGFLKNQLFTDKESDDVTFAIQLRAFLLYPLAQARQSNNQEEITKLESSIDNLIKCLRLSLSSVESDRLYAMGLKRVMVVNPTGTKESIVIANNKTFFAFLKDKFREKENIDIAALSQIGSKIDAKSNDLIDVLTNNFSKDAMSIIAGLTDEIFRDMRLPGIKAIMTPEQYSTKVQPKERLKSLRLVKREDGKYYLEGAQIRTAWKEAYRPLEELFIIDKKTNKYKKIKKLVLDDTADSPFYKKPVHEVINSLIKNQEKTYALNPVTGKYEEVNLIDQLKTLGIRIPLQNVNFISPFSILSFYDPSRGDIVSFPTETFIQMGADNDQDTVPMTILQFESNGKVYYADANMLNNPTYYTDLISQIEVVKKKIEARKEEFIEETGNYTINKDLEVLLPELEVILEKNNLPVALLFEGDYSKAQIFYSDSDYAKYFENVKINNKNRKALISLKDNDASFAKQFDEFKEALSNAFDEDGNLIKSEIDEDSIIIGLKNELKALYFERQTYKKKIANTAFQSMLEILERPQNYMFSIKTDSVAEMKNMLIEEKAKAEGMSLDEAKKDFETNLSPWSSIQPSTNIRLNYVNEQRPNLGTYISQAKMFVILSGIEAKLNALYKPFPLDKAKKRRERQRLINFPLKATSEKLPSVKNGVVHTFSLRDVDGKLITDKISQLASIHIDVYKEIELMLNVGFNSANKSAVSYLIQTGHSDGMIQQFVRNPFIAYFYDKVNKHATYDLKYKHVVADFFRNQNSGMYQNYFNINSLPIDFLGTINKQFSDNVNEGTQRKLENFYNERVHPTLKNGEVLYDKIVQLNEEIYSQISKNKLLAYDLVKVYNNLTDEQTDLLNFLIMYSLQNEVVASDYSRTISPIMLRETQGLTSIDAKIKNGIATERLNESSMFDKSSIEKLENQTMLGIFQSEDVVNSMLTITLPNLVKENLLDYYKTIQEDTSMSKETHIQLQAELIDTITSVIINNFYMYNENNDLDGLLQTFNQDNVSFFKGKTLYQSFFSDVNIGYGANDSNDLIDLIQSEEYATQFIDNYRNAKKYVEVSEAEKQRIDQQANEALQNEVLKKTDAIYQDYATSFFKQLDPLKSKYAALFKYLDFVDALSVRFEPTKIIADNEFTLFDDKNKRTSLDLLYNVTVGNTRYNNKTIIPVQNTITYFNPLGDSDKGYKDKLARMQWESLTRLDNTTASVEKFITNLSILTTEDYNNIKKLFYDKNGNLNESNINELKTFFTILAHYSVAQSGLQLDKMFRLKRIAPSYIVDQIFSEAYENYAKFNESKSGIALKNKLKEEVLNRFKLNSGFNFFSDVNTIQRKLEKNDEDDMDTDMEEVSISEFGTTENADFKTIVDIYKRIKINPLSLPNTSLFPMTPEASPESNSLLLEIAKTIGNDETTMISGEKVIKEMYKDNKGIKLPKINFTIKNEDSQTDPNSITQTSC